jgi:multidrug efflux pump subunit AcrB
VLAIGLVVDDAIVVVENVERQLEQGLSPITAAVAAMREVTGPIIATTAVLLAVFVPVAFLPGVTGRLYNQFALTIAISVAISAFNSLTLSPALCAVLLRHRPPSRWLAFRAFNAGFTYAAQAYANGIRRVIGARWAALALFAAGLVLTYGIYSRIPAGFLPVEDQGYLFAVIQLPDGASLQRTEAVAEKVRTILAAQDGVMDVIPVTGTNFLTGANQ